MKLHYSQTHRSYNVYGIQFQYLMKLHYSQTFTQQWDAVDKFQYLMKLHYSQTSVCLFLQLALVSVPYEITLLSNNKLRFTSESVFQYLMKLHYSQTSKWDEIIILQFQYLMKLHYSQTSKR